jgi:hypothetical protein
MNLFKLIWREGVGQDSNVYEVMGSAEAVFGLWVMLLRHTMYPNTVAIYDLDGNKQKPERGLREGLIGTNPYVPDPAVF